MSKLSCLWKVFRKTNAGIIFFPAFYAIPRNVITEKDDENGGYSHFLFSCSVPELPFVLGVIERCVLPFRPLTACAPTSCVRLLAGLLAGISTFPSAISDGLDVTLWWPRKWKLFLLVSALSSGLQQSSCECMWVCNLPALHKHFSFYYSVFVVGTVLMINASPSPDLLYGLVFFKFHQKFE